MGVDLFDKTVVSTYDAIIKVGDNDTITSSAKRLSDGRGNDTAIWLSTTNMGVNAAPTAGYTLTVNGNILGTKIDATTFQILGGTGTQGTLYWDSDENTVDLIQNGTTLEIGQQVEVNVKNQTASTIPKGTPVYVTGTLGASGRLTVAPFIADGSIDGKFFLGVTAEDIINGEDGKLLTFGKIRGLDTSAYSEGQTLFISDTVAGEFQTTAPTSPSLVFEIAIVINSSVNNGTIFVRTGGTTSAGSTLQEVTDNGNTTTNSIGIGTTPASGVELHVKDSVGNTEIRIEQSDVDTAYGILRFAGDDPSGSKYIIAYNSNDAFQPNEISLKNALGDITFHNGTAGAVERVRIDASTGNVGIGTTSVNANSKLHVKDDDGAEIRIEDTTSTTFGTLRFVGDTSTFDKGLTAYNSANAFDANALHLYNTAGDIVFRADTGGGTGAERMRIDASTGNVGIGTSSVVNSRMQIDTSGTSTSQVALRLRNPNGNGSTGTSLYFQSGYSDDISATSAITGYRDGAANTSFLTFSTVQSGPSLVERMRIDSIGRVGIGTTSPSAFLHIKSDLTANQDQFLIESTNSDGGTAPDIALYRNSATPSAQDNLGAIWFYGNDSVGSQEIYSAIYGELVDPTSGSASGGIQFLTSKGGGIGTSMTLYEDRLGIGTETPNAAAKLHVVDNDGAEIRIEDTTSTTFQILRLVGDASTEAKGLVGYNSASSFSANNLRLFNAGGDVIIGASTGGGTATERMRITSSGNVGIGITSPEGVLHTYTPNTMGLLSSPTLSNAALVIEETTGVSKMYFDGNTIYGTSSIVIGTTTLSPMQFGTNGSIRLTIEDSGLLVFDTCSDINVNNSIGRFTNNYFYITGGVGTIISADSTRDTRIRIDATDYINLETAGNIAVKVLPNGNVGIGDTSPNQKLTVVDDAANIIVAAKDTSYSKYLGLGAGTSVDAAILTAGSGTTENVDLIIRTASGGSEAERMRITSSGNVGIGTSSPNSKLHISNSGAEGFEFEVAQSSEVNRILSYNRTSSTYNVFKLEGLRFEFFTSGSEKIRIDNSGRLGIGTTSPAARLHLSGGDMYVDGVSGFGYSHSIIFRTNSTAEDVGIRSVGEAFEIYEPEQSDKIWFRILDDPEGNSAAALLNSPTGLTPVLTDYNKGDYIDSTYVRSFVDKTYIDSLNVDADTLDGINSAQFLRSDTSDTFSGSVLTINNSLGIGTSSPTDKLDVRGDAIIYGDGGTIGSSGSISSAWLKIGTGLGFDDNQMLYTGTGYINAVGTLQLAGGGNGASIVMSITGSRVGINDATPSYDLDVNGTIRATADVIAYSDIRVKENINTIDNALEKVRNLRGVEYNKIGETEQKIGVIAQEVEKVIPQVVQEDEEGMKSVAYGNIVGVLIEAIKEQQEQIEDLKAQVERLIATR